MLRRDRERGPRRAEPVMSPVMAVAYWILKSRSGCRVRKMENAPSGIQRGMGEKRTAGESCRRNADATCFRSLENRRRDVLTGRKVRIRERKNRDKSDFTRVRWQGGQKAPRTRSEDEGQGTSTLKRGRRLGRSTWVAETLSTNIWLVYRIVGNYGFQSIGIL